MREYTTESFDVCGPFMQARELNSTLNLLAKTIAGIMSVKGSSIRLLDEKSGSLLVAASYGLSESYLKKGPVLLSESPPDREILRGKIVGTKDVTKEPGAVYREEAEREGIRSILNVPLMSGERAIGVVRIYTGSPREFTDEEIERLKSLASFGGIIIDRARLSDRMRTLICMAQTVTSSLSLDEVLQLITENAAKSLGMKAASIRLLNPDRTSLEVKAAYGLSPGYLGKGPVELEKSPVDRECLAGRCALVSDINKAERFQYPEEIKKEGINAVLTVPLRIRENAIGILRIYSDAPYEFSPAEIEFANTLASYGAIAIENARLYEHVRNEYEELTKDVWKWYDWGSRFPAV